MTTKKDFSAELQSLLNEFSKQKPKNEATLFKEAIDRLNKGIASFGAFIMDKEGRLEEALTPEQLAKLRVLIPQVLMKPERSFADRWAEIVEATGKLEFPKELQFQVIN